MASEMERMRQRSQKAKNRGDWLEVVELLEKYRKALPDDKAAALDLGDALMKLERFDDACRLYAELFERWPKNPIIASNLGAALLRCGNIQDSRQLLEYCLTLDPKNLYARINLGGVFQASRDYKAALQNALEAVSVEPTHPLTFNNLGSAFSDLAQFNEAKHAYETSLMLDPTNVDASINLATVEARLGNSKQAIEMFERTLGMLPPESIQRAQAVRFYSSFEYLKLGDLKNGWRNYEGGFSPLVPITGRRSPQRNFDVARFNEEVDEGTTVLLWREQGLGDEIMFATCIPDILMRYPKCNFIFECDRRMTGIWSRAFPSVRVRAEPSLFELTSVASDFDRHLPIGSLPSIVRGSLDRFHGSPKIALRASSEKLKFYKEWLNAEGREKSRRVGICWRSGVIDPNRALEYSNLDEWSFLSENSNYDIVCLQYDECEQELCQAERLFGRKVLRPPCDRKNDLEDMLAIIQNLDLVISAHTAVLHLAAFGGQKCVSVSPDGPYDWPYLGQERFPWYSNVESIKRSSLHELSLPIILP